MSVAYEPVLPDRAEGREVCGGSDSTVQQRH